MDLWTTVVPPGAYTQDPALIWSNTSAPDPRLWNATNRLGVAMNLTFLNATIYLVRVAPSSTPSEPYLMTCLRRSACRTDPSFEFDLLPQRPEGAQQATGTTASATRTAAGGASSTQSSGGSHAYVAPCY